jgi:hypothetical protein
MMTDALSNAMALLTGESSMGKVTGDDGARPTPDEIARLAYRFYEDRGQESGRDVDDWLLAEAN